MRKFARYLAVLLIVAGVGVLAATPALGQSAIGLVVNGRPVSTDVPPQLINGRVLVPIRAVSEALGCSVSYDSTARRVTVTSGAATGAGTGAGAGGLAVADVSGLFKAAAPSVVAILAYSDYGRGGEPDIQGWGSGFVARADGWILTNAHVVEGATQLKVIFPDGRTYDVSVSAGVAADEAETSDVAVVHIQATGLTPLPFGDSDKVAVGEPVAAIGNPATLQLRNTVTAGIVSGVSRGLGESYYHFIQTDAAINPGNSGGPLLNARGEVIGITSMKFVHESVESLGFAVPINAVKTIMSDLIAQGRVIRPWLGVIVGESWQASYGLPTDEGLLIVAVTANGPAAKAGIQANDTIVSVDGREVHSKQDLYDIFLTRKVGDTLTVTVRRPGVDNPMSFQVTLAERPAASGS